MSPEMSPARVLAEQLADARRGGQHFSDVWPDAVAAALEAAPNKWERRDWRIALAETVDAWRAAFDRLPASSPEHALTSLAEIPDGEPRVRAAA
jgi:hypothetical protein